MSLGYLLILSYVCMGLGVYINMACARFEELILGEVKFNSFLLGLLGIPFWPIALYLIYKDFEK